MLYDANLITLSATTNVTFSEDVGARFEAYGWHVQRIDGQDVAAVDAALTAARADEDRPSLIVARTHIGYGSPHKQDTFARARRAARRRGGAPDEARARMARGSHVLRARRGPARVSSSPSSAARSSRRRGGAASTPTAIAHPDLAAQFARALAGELPEGWEAHLPAFTPADGEMATRDAGGAGDQRAGAES